MEVFHNQYLMVISLRNHNDQDDHKCKPNIIKL